MPGTSMGQSATGTCAECDDTGWAKNTMTLSHCSRGCPQRDPRMPGGDDRPDPLDRMVSVREVVQTLNDGCGWPAGTPEYKAMVQTAALIEQGLIGKGQ